jgi:hypothetical protein
MYASRAVLELVASRSSRVRPSSWRRWRLKPFSRRYWGLLAAVGVAVDVEARREARRRVVHAVVHACHCTKSFDVWMNGMSWLFMNRPPSSHAYSRRRRAMLRFMTYCQLEASRWRTRFSVCRLPESSSGPNFWVAPAGLAWTRHHVRIDANASTQKR